MNIDVLASAVELAVETVSTSDLERHHGNVPRMSGRLEWIINVAHVEDVDLLRSELDRSGDRDRVHDAAVDVVLSVDHDWRKNAGQRARRKYCVDNGAVGEPVLRRGLDTRRAGLDGDGGLLELSVRNPLLDKLAQRVIGVEMGPVIEEESTPLASLHWRQNNTYQRAWTTGKC